jgi:hypothetical protein
MQQTIPLWDSQTLRFDELERHGRIRIPDTGINLILGIAPRIVVGATFGKVYDFHRGKAGRTPEGRPGLADSKLGSLPKNIFEHDTPW